ncbi:MAG TPA: DNA repair protein RecO [Desulfosalsimonadaceae bacterium]|nr:DNA repair protein RecO [Desulfosalsimonadaceae bacterium]
MYPLPSTSAILLRRIAYSEYDLILTLFTLAFGRISMIAKYARKSRKRFCGTLELFSEIGAVGSVPEKGGLPVLQEAWVKNPFAGIRGDLQRTAYASYWSELVLAWLEEGRAQENIYHLLRFSLDALDSGRSPAAASIVFQLYFLQFSGLGPNLQRCSRCGIFLEDMPGDRCGFDLAKGGLVCQQCTTSRRLPISLSRGTVKQLLWLQSSRLRKVERLKFSEPALRESLSFLEAFVPYHLGREPRSLKFLHHIRSFAR